MCYSMDITIDAGAEEAEAQRARVARAQTHVAQAVKRLTDRLHAYQEQRDQRLRALSAEMTTSGKWVLWVYDYDARALRQIPFGVQVEPAPEPAPPAPEPVPEPVPVRARALVAA